MPHGQGSLGAIAIGSKVYTFVENIDIRETGRLRLAEYRIVGRRHTMYGDLGADSKQWTLSFTITRNGAGMPAGESAQGLINSLRFGVYGSSAKVVVGAYADSYSIKGIIKSYTISHEDAAGYTGKTPNRYKVTMVIGEVP